MFFWERKLQCSEEISGLHDTELPDTWCVVENTTIMKRRNEDLMRIPSALVLPTAATLNFGVFLMFVQEDVCFVKSSVDNPIVHQLKHSWYRDISVVDIVRTVQPEASIAQDGSRLLAFHQQKGT